MSEFFIPQGPYSLPCSITLLKGKPLLNPKDFTFTSDAFGYSLSYKGQPIGGAGTVNRARKHPRTAEADRELYARGARMEIANLVDGRGPRYMRDYIQQIDQQQPSTVH